MGTLSECHSVALSTIFSTCPSSGGVSFLKRYPTFLIFSYSSSGILGNIYGGKSAHFVFLVSGLCGLVSILDWLFLHGLLAPLPHGNPLQFSISIVDLILYLFTRCSLIFSVDLIDRCYLHVVLFVDSWTLNITGLPSGSHGSLDGPIAMVFSRRPIAVRVQR